LADDPKRDRTQTAQETNIFDRRVRAHAKDIAHETSVRV
jgi:hypothetical protein